VRALLVDYPPYGPWDEESRALAHSGGTLELLTAEQFAAGPPDAELLLNAWAAPAPAALLDRMPALRWAVSYGVGVDWIDLDEAARRRISVVNMPLANVEDVATHALALMLACARRLRELDQAVRGGEFGWPRERPLHRLSGRRLGLLAFGNIARRVAALAAPLGLRVSAHDPYVAPEVMLALGVEPAELEPLLASSDILSVHLPSTPETRGLLDARRLSLLPPGALVVITSRGEIYDGGALAQALQDGRIAAAGLDVFPEEPLPPDHPLAGLPNVVLTPHVAGYSEEAIRDLHETAAAVIRAVAAGETPPGVVREGARA
jgi:D-3-phosphoglycerate dehydrogenase